jgi:protein FAM32A
MPGDEYSAVGGGGALKLKGAKVTKKKKKSKTSLEKNLSAAEGALKKRSESPAKDDKSAKPDGDRPEGEEEDRPVQQTESERQFEEIKRKRVGAFFPKSIFVLVTDSFLAVENGRVPSGAAQVS